jgi:hypothetical protein
LALLNGEISMISSNLCKLVQDEYKASKIRLDSVTFGMKRFPHLRADQVIARDQRMVAKWRKEHEILR